jgi:hypothetical protein
MSASKEELLKRISCIIKKQYDSLIILKVSNHSVLMLNVIRNVYGYSRQSIASAEEKINELLDFYDDSLCCRFSNGSTINIVDYELCSHKDEAMIERKLIRKYQREKRGTKCMKMSIRNLENCFNGAMEQEHTYIAVAVKIKDAGVPEFIINHLSNFKAKLDYYKAHYTKDLKLRTSQDIRIVAFAFGDSFKELEDKLINQIVR